MELSGIVNVNLKLVRSKAIQEGWEPDEKVLVTDRSAKAVRDSGSAYVSASMNENSFN